MAEDWNTLAARFERLAGGDLETQGAIAGIAALARHISDGSLARSLFGWSSMADLCIQQTDVMPNSGPFLRVHPQDDGTVEFRYEDTKKSDRQWSRTVPADASVARFETFLDQLHWIAH